MRSRTQFFSAPEPFRSVATALGHPDAPCAAHQSPRPPPRHSLGAHIHPSTMSSKRGWSRDSGEGSGGGGGGGRRSSRSASSSSSSANSSSSSDAKRSRGGPAGGGGGGRGGASGGGSGGGGSSTSGGGGGRWDANRIQTIVVMWLLAASGRTSEMAAVEFKNLALPGESGLSARTIRQWRQWWDMFGETKPSVLRRLGGRRGRQGKVREVHVALLTAIVKDHPEFYVDEIRDEFNIRLCDPSFHLSPSTIWKTLVTRCGYSLRVANMKAAQRDESLRHQYRTALSMYDDPAMFVFIDETHKDRNAARRRRAWGPRGANNDVDAVFAPAGDSRWTLLAAADIDGFVGAACHLVHRKHDTKDTDTSRGTVDTTLFLWWVEHCLCPSLGNFEKGEPRCVVVADNAPTHQSDEFRELIERAGAKLIFTAPYSPDLNPIEYAFAQYKAYLRKNSRFTEAHPLTAHDLALDAVCRENMIAYYKHIGCIHNLPKASVGGMQATAAASILIQCDML